MRRLKQILEWGHGGILLSVLAPILYGVFVQETVYHMEKVWLLNLLIFPVIAGTDLLAERCRRISAYLFFSILCIFVVNMASWKLHGLAGTEAAMDIGIGVAVTLALESFLIFIERILIRLHGKRSLNRQENDPDWRPRQSILTRPQAVYAVVFVFAYGVGKYCNNPVLCDISLGILPVYLCVALFYCYLAETEEYLFLNKRVCNLPRKRFYGISGSICLIFLSGILCLGILSGAVAGYRSYSDIRDLLKGQTDVSGVLPIQFWEELESGAGWENEMTYLMDMEIRETPAWMKMFEKGLAVAAVLLVILLGIYGFRRISRRFRETFDENGDVVEELEEEETASRVMPVHVIRGKLTEAERIRRQYRRTIRQHRKEPPGLHESPYEIESGAGIADTEEGRQLHDVYERVRYRQTGN